MKLTATFTLLVASLGSASGSLITYNTTDSSFTGTFNGSAVSGSSISATSGASTATLTYSPIVGGSTFNDAAPGTNISYGFFTLSFSGPAASIPFPVFNFSLKVNETAPGVGTQSIVAVSTAGQVSANSSNVNVFYVPTTFTLPSSLTPNTAYTIVNPTQIVAPTTNGGVSSIQGFAVGGPASSTPEPMSSLLMGAGLIGLGGLSRWRLFRRS